LKEDILERRGQKAETGDSFMIEQHRVRIKGLASQFLRDGIGVSSLIGKLTIKALQVVGSSFLLRYLLLSIYYPCAGFAGLPLRLSRPYRYPSNREREANIQDHWGKGLGVSRIQYNLGADACRQVKTAKIECKATPGGRQCRIHLPKCSWSHWNHPCA
jgi:hypothetical protein